MSYIRKKTIDRPNADRHNSTLPPPPLLSVAFGVYTDQQAERRHCRPAGRPDSDLPPVSTAAAGLTSSQCFSYHLTTPSSHSIDYETFRLPLPLLVPKRKIRISDEGRLRDRRDLRLRRDDCPAVQAVEMAKM